VKVEKVLKEIVQHHVEALSDDKKLRAMLKDYFPEDKRAQNTLLMVVDEGILDDMQGKSCINKFQMFGYIKGIVGDYGVSEAIAKTAIMNWAKAMGIDAADVPVNDESQGKKANVSITPEIVDYSQVTSDEAIIKGKIIKITGNGAKVFPGILIPPGTYLVQETGGVYAKFYDSSNHMTYIINELNKSKHEKVFQTPNYMKFSVPGTLEVGSNHDWTLLMKPIG